MGSLVKNILDIDCSSSDVLINKHNCSNSDHKFKQDFFKGEKT
jgi:hypothetical protein